MDDRGTALPKWILIDNVGPQPIRAHDEPVEGEPLPDRITAGAGRFAIEWKTIEGGKSRGMKCLMIDTGKICVAILPDRGMGIWKCWADHLEFGWSSPVHGPVHPSLVPVGDPTGIGWLEGFDELLVRCGLHSNGAPEFDSNGRVLHPLHGRIANIPASKLQLEIDIENGVLDVTGVVCESRFLVYTLELTTRYRFRAHSPVVEIVDTVTNKLSTPSSMQMLYHINVGQPILHSGARVNIPFRSLSPRDARAASSISEWDLYGGPEEGFDEQVYFVEPLSDDQHWTEAMLCSSDATHGFAVHYDTRTLPYFNLWKQTGAVEDGYVTGLEPATGFPNVRSFEEKNARVISLQGGESKTFRLKLQPLTTSNEVTQSLSRISQLQSTIGVIHDQPVVGVSSSATAPSLVHGDTHQ